MSLCLNVERNAVDDDDDRTPIELRCTRRSGHLNKCGDFRWFTARTNPTPEPGEIRDTLPL